MSYTAFTVVRQLPETSVFQNAPNQKSIIDNTLGNVQDNEFEKLSVEVPSRWIINIKTTTLFTIYDYGYIGIGVSIKSLI